MIAILSLTNFSDKISIVATHRIVRRALIAFDISSEIRLLTSKLCVWVCMCACRGVFPVIKMAPKSV